MFFLVIFFGLLLYLMFSIYFRKVGEIVYFFTFFQTSAQFSPICTGIAEDLDEPECIELKGDLGIFHSYLNRNGDSSDGDGKWKI